MRERLPRLSRYRLMACFALPFRGVSRFPEEPMKDPKLPGVSQGAAIQRIVCTDYGFAVISEGRSTAPVNLRSLSCEEDPTKTPYFPARASHLPVVSLK